MKMSSSDSWGNRPRAREEITSNQQVGGLFIASIFLLVIVASCSAIAVMFGVQILNDAGAIGWTLSYRQSQWLTFLALILRSLFRATLKSDK